MLKDITLGQYFPGNTPIHRLDPRTKLILTTLYIVGLFLARSFWGLGLWAVFLWTVIVVSHVNMRLLLRTLRPLILILGLTGLLNVFFTSGEPLVSFWVITITREGLRWAAILVLRIVLLVMGTFILTYTTAPMALTDGLEYLGGPLRRIRVPVHEMALIMSTALRFIPTLLEETDKIMRAQKARGANFETGSIAKRGRALLPIFVPLFIGAFRRADELAIAMESRCYHGGESRTRMRQLRFQKLDMFAGIIGAILAAAIILMRMDTLARDITGGVVAVILVTAMILMRMKGWIGRGRKK